MSDRPISFSGPMVRAILEGRKTQTRRVIGPQPVVPFSFLGDIIRDEPNVRTDDHGRVTDTGKERIIPIRFAVGDRLWVREAWRTWEQYDLFPPRAIDAGTHISYAATPKYPNLGNYPGKLRPSMFMPRWASRLTLAVTDVRVQRLQEITEDDAQAEGLSTVSKDGKLWKWGIPDRDGLPGSDDCGWDWENWRVNARDAFSHLWDSINAKRGFGWDANPWVVAVSFEARHCNIDTLASKDAAG